MAYDYKNDQTYITAVKDLEYAQKGMFGDSSGIVMAKAMATISNIQKANNVAGLETYEPVYVGTGSIFDKAMENVRTMATGPVQSVQTAPILQQVPVQQAPVQTAPYGYSSKTTADIFPNLSLGADTGKIVAVVGGFLLIKTIFGGIFGRR